MAKELSKSSSNLQDVVYSGRPRNEEPHVKRSTKKKQEHIEYIVRVDLDELKISDDDFEDLQSLFKLFDLDRDGILNFKEYEKLLRCLGYRLPEDQARSLANSVSVDKTNYSMSFNEFLKLMSHQQESEPDEETLIDVFTSFDKENTGKISERMFRQIMLGKEGISESEIREMLEEYYRLAKLKGITSSPLPPTSENEGGASPAFPMSPERAKDAASRKNKRNSKNQDKPEDIRQQLPDEKYIDYKEFAAMLQQ